MHNTYSNDRLYHAQTENTQMHMNEKLEVLMICSFKSYWHTCDRPNVASK